MTFIHMVSIFGLQLNLKFHPRCPNYLMLDTIKENLIIFLLFATTEDKSKDNTETKTGKEKTTTKTYREFGFNFPCTFVLLEITSINKNINGAIELS